MRLIEAWRAAVPEAIVLPLCATAALSRVAFPPESSPRYPRVIFGAPLPPQIPITAIVAAIEELAAVTGSE